MSTGTTKLRLALLPIMGELGKLVDYLDTIDEIARNPTIGDQAADAAAINAELQSAYDACTGIHNRNVELSAQIEKCMEGDLA